MDRPITQQFSTNFKVDQQCDNVLIGLRGINCHGMYYNVKMEVTPVITSAYSKEHGINNTVDTVPLRALNICTHCHRSFDETEEMERHLKSYCDNNDVAKERHVNVNIPHQIGHPNRQQTSTPNQLQTNNGSTGAPVQRYRQPSQAPFHRHPRTMAAPVISNSNRTGVQRCARQPQPSAAASYQAFAGSSSCNDRNKQRNTLHACRQFQKVPPTRVPHNNEATVARPQLQSLEGRSQNRIPPTEVENIRVQAEVQVLVPPGPSIRAALRTIGPTHDRSRSRVRNSGRHRNVNQHSRNPSDNNENETHPTSFQFPCRILGCTRAFNTITELTDHAIGDHALEYRRYWELNPKPKCLACGKATDDFKKTPPEFLSHVFECKRGRKEKEPHWKPNLSKLRHGLPRDWDEELWCFKVHNHLETHRKRARSVSGIRAKAPPPSDRVLRARSQIRDINAPSTGADVNHLPASAPPPFDASSSIMPPTDDLQNIHHLSPEDPQLPLRQNDPRTSSLKQSSKRRKN